MALLLHGDPGVAMTPPRVGPDRSLSPARSSILNLPGESTLRRDFLRLQLANKERSEALRRQQLEQQQRENEEHKRQLLAERQKRIEEQKEQRRRLEEVRTCPGVPSWVSTVALGHPPEAAACLEHSHLNYEGGGGQGHFTSGDGVALVWSHQKDR